jgi:WD40 repeat protein
MSEVCLNVTIGQLEDLELDSDLTIVYSPYAQLKVGERIIRVGGEPFADRGTLRLAISTYSADTSVEVALLGKVDVPLENSCIVDGAVATVKDARSWHSNAEEEELAPEAIRDGLAVLRKKPSGVNQDSTPVSPSPQLLEFSRLEINNSAPFLLEGQTDSRKRLIEALRAVQTGKSVVILTENVSPLHEIEVLSKLSRREFIVVNCGEKLKARPSQTQILHGFVEAMMKGRWFVVLQGHKSLATLRLLDTAIADARARRFEGWSPNAKILIGTEPHIHFPSGIAENCVTYRFRACFDETSLVETLHSSLSKRKLIYGSVRAVPRDGAASYYTSGFSASPIGLESDTKKKRVKMSTAIDVVEIPSRNLMSEVIKPQGLVPGGLQKVASFNAAQNDKFLSLAPCDPDCDRIAVGSSLGNVYFLDADGNSLTVMHAHDASVWDISCRTATTFVTGSEDCTAIRWGPLPGGYAQQNQIAKCGHDIFAVKYLHPTQDDSPVFVGGLMSVIVGLTKSGVVQIPVPTSIQALEPISDRSWLVGGGGDGSVVVADATRLKVISTLASHAKKVPTVSYNGQGQFVSGGFDNCIKLWDCNQLTDPVHTIKLKSYVTGVAYKGYTLAASVGQNLYLWDVRNLSQIQAGVVNAWQSLSRGLLIDAQRHHIITASPDGEVRYWKYQ